MAASDKTKQKLQQLEKQLEGRSAMLIVLQDNPDPDALAAAVGLRRLANELGDVSCSIASGGRVGRSENRALVRYLQLNLRLMDEIDLSRFDLIAMVDTQPGQGNNSLPSDVKPDLVIDHHPVQPASRKLPFSDIRSKYGATCTILFEYLWVAGVKMDVDLATALLYGIRSDTQDLGRETTQADIEAYSVLYLMANKRALGAIQRGRVPSDYFCVLASALDRARICGNSIYCDLGEIENADMISEVADLLLRHEDIDWTLCWACVNGDTLLSLRTSLGNQDAKKVLKLVVGKKGTAGGHRSMAGGQIPLEKTTLTHREELATDVRKRFIKAIGGDLSASRSLC